MKKFILSAALLLWTLNNIWAQVVINEACSDNWSVAEDEDGDNSDWFELFNAGTSAISLADYSVKDNSGEQWFFPNLTMNPGTFMLVFASGKNRTGSELHTSFKLSKEGDLIILKNHVLLISDTFRIDPLMGNMSFGNKTDGLPAVVGIFNIPTPGSTNNVVSCYSSMTEIPIFSLKSGFYSSPLTLSLSCNQPGISIRYTTDGSTPVPGSDEYVSPLVISSTTCLKARAFDSDTTALPSPVMTNTYFIGYTSALPVFSISTEPANLWDADSGIYVLGNCADSVYPYLGANFWQDWEVPAHIEFFETNRRLALEQDLGLSINGGSVSRNKPQKSFRLTAKNKYGSSTMEHRFFDDKNIVAYKTLVLRNASGDWNKAHFRDGCVHDLLSGNTDIDVMSYRPSAVFLNGEYWGILNIRERVSKYYLRENYHIDENSVDILEEDSTIIEGSFAEFTPVFQFITQNDMQNAALYDSATTMIDIHSLCDYFIAETFFSNIDWPYNNIKYWKEHGSGHRWRYLLIDLDITFGNSGWAPDSMDILKRILGPYGSHNMHIQIFKSLLQNTEFKNYFINRYADLINTLFTANRLHQHISETAAYIENEIPSQFIRWGVDPNTWYNEINNVIYPYTDARPQYALNHIQENFGLTAQIPIRLDVWPPAGGTVQMNTIQPEFFPWEGIYFEGIPVTVKAIANSGFTFSGWTRPTAGSTLIQTNILTFDPETENAVTANFLPAENSSSLIVFPNPADDILHFGCSVQISGNGLVEISDAEGKILLSQPVFLTTGTNHFDISVSSFSNGIYTLLLHTLDGLLVTKILISH